MNWRVFTPVSVLVLSLLSVGWFVGCGPQENTQEPPVRREPPKATTTYFGHAKTILDTHCGTCHKEKGVGPFDLTNYEQVSKIKALIKSSIESKKMPPWNADDNCNDYQGSLTMSADDQKMLLKWIDEGGAKGDASTYKAPPPAPQEGLDRVDLTLQLPVKYTPPKGSSDDYRCFMIDWPHKETKYITGYRFVPDNKATVHHVIAYLIPPKQVEKYKALDEKDEGPGYTCFGGPGGEASQGSVGFLGGWAPGSVGGNFPKGTGMKIEPGSKIVLQMHYNTPSGEPTPDQSKAEFKLDDTVDKEARVQPFANPQWLSGKTMHIPAGELDVKHKFAWDIASLYGRQIHIHTAALHMHLRGKTAKLSIEHKDGNETCLLNIPKWDFNWQRSYALKKPVLLKPGDKLKIQCSFDNSAKNQPILNGKRLDSKDVNWGEGTYDEMCVGFLYMTNAD